MLKMKRILVTIQMLVVIVPNATAYAADITAGYSVNPSKAEISINPGESKPVTIAVSNLHKDVQMYINVTFLNFTPQADGSPQVDKSAAPVAGLASWLSGVNRITVSAGANEQYTATVTVPKTAKAGAYYGLALFNNASNINDPPIGVTIIANVGSITKNLAIDSLNASALQVTAQWRAVGQVTLSVKNTGTGYFVPGKMLVELLDANKNVIDTEDANPGLNGIFPNYARSFKVDISKLVAPNQAYSVRAKLYTEINSQPITAESALTTPAIVANPTAKTPPIPNKDSKPKKNLFLYIGGGIAVVLLLFLGGFLWHDRLKKRAVRAGASVAPVADAAPAANVAPISDVPAGPQTTPADVPAVPQTTPVEALSEPIDTNQPPTEPPLA